MTIRARVVLTLTLSGLILFGVYSLYAYARERDHLEADAKSELALLTRSLRVAIENALRDQQIADVDETLTRLVEVKPTIQVIVYDVGGTHEVAASAGALSDEGLDYAVARAITDGREEATFEGERRLILASPLVDDDGTPLGAISVSRPLDDLTSSLARTRRDAMVTVAIFVLVAGTIAFLTTTFYVRRPLARVAGGMAEVRAGRLGAELPPQRHDEIGELADQFNQMARALADAHRRAEAEAEARHDLEHNLQRIDKMVTVGQLAAGLAHEIGSPLQVLLGRARAMVSSATDPDVKRNATTMVEQSERITRVVDQLLSYAKRRAPRREAVRLEQPVRTILDLIEAEARRRGVTVDLAVEGDTRIEADADQMQQVVLNLVSNAIAVSRRGGDVHVRIEACTAPDPATGSDRAMVRLAVDDSGPGIPEDAHARLFEPFFTTRAAEGGTGLGLAVVRSIVVEHGGTVTATSNAGVGARFEVMLPRSEGSRA